MSNTNFMSAAEERHFWKIRSEFSRSEIMFLDSIHAIGLRNALYYAEGFGLPTAVVLCELDRLRGAV